MSWILTLFAHELPLLQVLQLWDFFLAQPPTIIIALAASIIILRVDGTKGCLRDQISLLSAPPAVDLLHCKVSCIHLLVHPAPIVCSLSSRTKLWPWPPAYQNAYFAWKARVHWSRIETHSRFTFCAGFNPRDTHTSTTRFSMIEGLCVTCIDGGTVRAMISSG